MIVRTSLYLYRHSVCIPYDLIVINASAYNLGESYRDYLNVYYHIHNANITPTEIIIFMKSNCFDTSEFKQMSRFTIQLVTYMVTCIDPFGWSYCHRVMHKTKAKDMAQLTDSHVQFCILIILIYFGNEWNFKPIPLPRNHKKYACNIQCVNNICQWRFAHVWLSIDGIFP